MAEPARRETLPAPSFAQRVRAFRTARGLTHAELALAVGATIAAVRRWEAGTARPSVEEASRLSTLGMDGIGEADTNSLSIARLRGSTPRSRADQARYHREAGRRRFAFAGTVSEMVPAPYVLNGPADQVAFHEALLRLQMEPALAQSIEPKRHRRRLSLVAEVDGEPTSQALLERPREIATSWNSNYGSHGWHRYVGRFPPHVVRALLNHFQAASDDVVLDPFTGSGTTNVECRLLGVPSIGVEISPLSALIARTKSKFPESPFSLLELSRGLTDFYAGRWSAFIDAHRGTVPDHLAVLGRGGNLVSDFPNYERWLTPEALLGISIVAEYAAEVDGRMRDLLLVALSAHGNEDERGCRPGRCCTGVSLAVWPIAVERPLDAHRALFVVAVADSCGNSASRCR
jgi:transcriptional regulator with XRE-family HTH domain